MEERKPLLMKCGHTANATSYRSGTPRRCCATCRPEVGEVPMDEKDYPDISNRKAHCTACGREIPSSFDLPFFGYRKDRETDEYYCGCRGWD